MNLIPNSKFQIPNSSKRGFTMIEISIAVGIVVVISVVVVVSLFTRRSTVELDNATKQMVAMLREAQSRSVAQEDNAVWGVHFDNTTSTTAFYALFHTSYAATTTVKRQILPSRVQFASTSVSSGASLNITFAKLSGLPSTSTSISLQLITGQPAGTAAGVSRTASGLIFFDDFNRTNL